MSNVISISGERWQEADPDAVDPTEDVRGPDGLTPAEQRIWHLGYGVGWEECREEEDRISREILAKSQARIDARTGQPAQLRLVASR